MIASENSLAIAAAAGTTFYFSTGDFGTYFSGYPADSQYVVGVGGTTLFSTGTTAPFTLSTETTWAAAGSWCSNIVRAARVAERPRRRRERDLRRALRPGHLGGRRHELVRALRLEHERTGGTSSGGVGGTSVAAPELNGLAAVTANFIAAQTYAGPTPAMGFAAPVMYQMGNSPNYDNYFRDVYCGNTANPTGGPDGDSALPGWDAATGWGAPDWYNYSIGYARTLGATNLAVPPSLSNHYKWKCAKTPGNSSERGISCPTSSTCYAVGTASGATPWYAKFLRAARGARSTRSTRARTAARAGSRRTAT